MASAWRIRQHRCRWSTLILGGADIFSLHIRKYGYFAEPAKFKKKAEDETDVKFNKHIGEWPKDRFHSSYRLWELETFFDKWLYLLKHIHELQEIPKEFSDPFFIRLFMLVEIDNFTAEERVVKY